MEQGSPDDDVLHPDRYVPDPEGHDALATELQLHEEQDETVHAVHPVPCVVVQATQLLPDAW